MGKKPPEKRNPHTSSVIGDPPPPIDRGTTLAHPLHGGTVPFNTIRAKPGGTPLPDFKPQPPKQLHSFDDKHPRGPSGQFERRAKPPRK